MDAQKYGYLTVGDTVRIFLYSGSKIADTRVKRREKFEHFSLINFPLYVDKKTACNFLFRTRKAATIFFTAKLQLLFIYTLKSAMPVTKCVRNVQNAYNFLSTMKILIYYGTAEIYVSLFGTAQMIGIFQG